MTRSKAGRKKPSRLRYEQKHPTVSFRLEETLYARLKKHLEENGWSFADFVKIHLDKDREEIRSRAKLLLKLNDDILRCQQELKARREAMKTPLRREVDSWYQEEQRRFERAQAYNESRLTNLRSEVRQEQQHLEALKMQIKETEREFQEVSKEYHLLEQKSQATQRQIEVWQKQMKLATWFINTCPWAFCEHCPDYPRRIFSGIMSMAVPIMALEMLKRLDVAELRQG